MVVAAPVPPRRNNKSYNRSMGVRKSRHGTLGRNHGRASNGPCRPCLLSPGTSRNRRQRQANLDQAQPHVLGFQSAVSYNTPRLRRRRGYLDPPSGLPISLIGSVPIPMNRTKIYICEAVKLQTSPPTFAALSKLSAQRSSPSEKLKKNVLQMRWTAWRPVRTLAGVTAGHSRHDLALAVAMPQPTGPSSAELGRLHLIVSGHTTVF